MAAANCWVCPGCLCAVCSRCRRLYTAMPPVEEPEGPFWSSGLTDVGERLRYKEVEGAGSLWWTSTCACRRKFSAEVLIPPACWLRDLANVAKYEDEPLSVSAEGMPAELVSGREVLLDIRERLESAAKLDDSGGKIIEAQEFDAVLDRVQKAALYFAVVGDAEYERVFTDLASKILAELEAIAPEIVKVTRDFARTTLGLRREMEAIDYPGGDPRIKNKIETLVFLQGMTEGQILAMMKEESDFRANVTCLFPHLMERHTQEPTSWWSRAFSRKKGKGL
jgi:hypothetical protein